MKRCAALSLTFLTLITVFSNQVLLAFPLADQTTAAQIDQSLPTTNKADGRFRLKLNALFKNGKKVTQQDAQVNLNIVWSLFGTNLSRAQELGFGTDPSATKISPNIPPFPILHVSLKDLRDFAPDKEVSDLLVFTNRLLFPVEINNQVTSSVTLRLDAQEMDSKNKETGLRIARWGLPKLITQLAQLTKQLPPDTERALISIPSLNRNFLGYEDDTVLKLIPLTNDYPFKAGQSYLAQDVFKQLYGEAESVDGSPR